MGRNRLAHETSPYLLQHADNPVDWYPWGEEAFARARRENKPVLLSIGYSSCHWCHVMAHESFEDPAIAALMNDLFVNVKVDREERPDVDEVYMHAVQLMIQRGGWPLTVFLTPELRPFHGGTYFPPIDRHGLPAFPRLLRAVADAYREKPEEVARVVRQHMDAIEHAGLPVAGEAALDPHLPRKAALALLEHVDEVHGGLGQAPKFPHTQAFQLMLRQFRAGGDQRLMRAARLAGERMAAGGMYDQIGGGFHRYSVDALWLVPHFEKMLYDNVQLPRLYLDLHQSTGDPMFRTVVEETLDYLCRELQHPDGGLFCATDADSEGVEGKFFVWTKAQVAAVVPASDLEVVCAYWGVTEAGNFDGSNVLHRAMTLEQAAAAAAVPVESARVAIATARRALLAGRARRVAPQRDEKILTGWNALGVATFAAVGAQLGIRRFVAAAERIAQFIWTRLRDGETLLHGWAGGAAKGMAFLDDHAYLADACIELFQATGRTEYLDWARELAAQLERRFHDDQGGAYFFTPHDGETLVARTKPGMDGSVPAGNAVAALALLKLHALTGEEAYARRAEEVLKVFQPAATRNPLAYGTYLEALELYTQGATEIVIVGAPDTEGARAMWGAAGRSYVPHRLSIPVDPGAPVAVAPARDRPQIAGLPTAYVCRQFACSAPVTEPEALSALLAS